jgi:hypothetical protein
MFTQFTKDTKIQKIQQDVSEINTLAKHAPIALTLLDRLHWQPQKHSRIKEGDVSPSGILNTFLIHTTTSKSTRYSIYNLLAHIDIKNINHKVALKINKAMKLSPMCVPINTSNSPNTSKVIYATK